MFSIDVLEIQSLKIYSLIQRMAESSAWSFLEAEPTLEILMAIK